MQTAAADASCLFQTIGVSKYFGDVPARCNDISFHVGGR